MLVPAGTSFSAAIVSRLRWYVQFPELSAYPNHQSADSYRPATARGVDNQVGYGVVDPVAAALTLGIFSARPSAQAAQRWCSAAAARPRDMTGADMGGRRGLSALLIGGVGVRYRDLDAAITEVIMAQRSFGLCCRGRGVTAVFLVDVLWIFAGQSLPRTLAGRSSCGGGSASAWRP